MSILYLDCLSGISGDMFVAASLDLGIPFEELKETLSKLPLRGYGLAVQRVRRAEISSLSFRVEVLQSQPPRNAQEVLDLIGESPLEEGIKERSIKVLTLLRDTEAEVHGIGRDEVHFHEIGAVDSIVDIVSASFCLQRLEVDRVKASSLPLSRGVVESAHGKLPLPAPAVLKLLEGVPVYGCELGHETVTPTGAAIIKAFAQDFGPIPPMRIIGVGTGAGQRDLPHWPNILRLLWGRALGERGEDLVAEIRANVDDRAPYELALFAETLLEKGALDVAMVPIYMKKNRPGVQLQILLRPEDLDRFQKLIFEQGITLGFRYQLLERKILPREDTKIDTPWGPVRAKRTTSPEGFTLIWPEYEDMKAIHREKGVPLWEIRAWISSHRSLG
ncbi:MAG: nickel pincer cofactor biosynthesis protein LarC [Desulfatiglandales bacterium]